MSITHIKKRNGKIATFERRLISRAILLAFEETEKKAADEKKVESLVDGVVGKLHTRFSDRIPTVEQIQDVVEEQLVGADEYLVAKTYILYRQQRSELRKKSQGPAPTSMRILKRSGEYETFDEEKLKKFLLLWKKNVTEISVDDLLREIRKNLFSDMTFLDLMETVLLSCTSLIEKDPSYNILGARLLLCQIGRDVFEKKPHEDNIDRLYRDAFQENIRELVKNGTLAEQMSDYDLSALAKALEPKRDHLLRYTGIFTLVDRYFLRYDGRCREMPQSFWMRVAMGIALSEKPEERTQWALQFYHVISQLQFIPSTPTLFHAGLRRPQLSSCYLTTVEDDLYHIFKCIGDNAQMSKWSGGIGNDWSNIRATGAYIKSTNVSSQGVIPFLKIANDTTVAINRSGKRRGATCAYLELWHLDIEDFLDLRRNTGDERRRTHDMNTAVWVPDLFMKRVLEKSQWTLFSPDEVPDLHDLYGAAFEARYHHYEQCAKEGKFNRCQTVEATKLFRKILTRLFETGHPWITFKDPCNIRSPQDHVGVVHSSNLCTEITLNTSAKETAVCNLGSLNLAQHTTETGINQFMLSETIRIAVRMLDDVIDINFYPTKEGAISNKQHRPVGLGVMGVQDALFTMRIPMADERAVMINDEIMELISYHAILSSALLAKERGPYFSFKGSKWDRDIFPIDSIALLEKERGIPVEVNSEVRMDWTPVRKAVRDHGMRNSNVMAIAPTATISNIAGCYPCIEAIYKNIYVKSNMSGEFLVINQYLVNDLKQLKMWNEEKIEQLKYYDGKIAHIPGIPDELKDLYKEVFDIDPIQLLRITAVRSKWIDQSQSHNIFLQGISGELLESVYMSAWKMGLKTTYYLRGMGASQIEKSTLNAKKYGYTQRRVYQPNLHQSS